MQQPEVNTKTRYNHYCRAVAKDGRICSLYGPHEGKHKPRHGLEQDRWEDGE